MSEKMYVLLLGLYPSQFRKAYGDEAIQLFRDRFRDEQGFLARVRLWWDLLADLVVSLPRERGYLRPSLVSVPSRPRLEGVPCFDVLEAGSPRLEALCLGAAVSVIVLAAVSISMNWTARNGGVRGSVPPDFAPAAIEPSAFGNSGSRYARISAGEPATPRRGNSGGSAANWADRAWADSGSRKQRCDLKRSGTPACDRSRSRESEAVLLRS